MHNYLCVADSINLLNRYSRRNKCPVEGRFPTAMSFLSDLPKMQGISKPI
jgi:hypothetical protein